MAERLVEDMEMDWDPAKYHDTYRDDLLKMIEEKAHGKVKAEPKKRATREAEVIDFASLLEKSLGARRKGGEGASTRRAANDEEHAPKRARAPAAKARKKSTATHRRAA
jgi:DNA end-binding protein Ku